MAKKKPVKAVSKTKTAVKSQVKAKLSSKPPKVVKSDKKIAKKSTPAKVVKKPAPVKAKVPLSKKVEKLAKVEKDLKKVVPPKEKKVEIKAEKQAKGKAPTKDEKVKVKAKKSAEERELEEYEEELEQASISYGDAIRLTPQDLEDPEDIVLTDADGKRYCKVKDCDQLATVEGHCRFHYLALWKKIQIRKKILMDGKLEKYIEELTSRYPDKYVEMIRRDLKTEKDFLSAISELEIDDSAEGEMEDESVLEEVRGMGGARRPGTGDEGSGSSSDESF